MFFSKGAVIEIITAIIRSIVGTSACVYLASCKPQMALSTYISTTSVRKMEGKQAKYNLHTAQPTIVMYRR